MIVATFSTNGNAPIARAARSMFQAVASIVLPVREGAARCPSSMLPARTNARCSDQHTGCTSSTNRANCPSRRSSTAVVEASPSETLNRDGHLPGQPAKRTSGSARLQKRPFGDDLDDVDAILRPSAWQRRGAGAT
jgi:hypothetical protein